MKRLTGIAALVAALACGDSRPLVPCSSDAECKAGRKCVDGYCESGEEVVGGDDSTTQNGEKGVCTRYFENCTTFSVQDSINQYNGKCAYIIPGGSIFPGDCNSDTDSVRINDGLSCQDDFNYSNKGCIQNCTSEQFLEECNKKCAVEYVSWNIGCHNTDTTTRCGVPRSTECALFHCTLDTGICGEKLFDLTSKEEIDDAPVDLTYEPYRPIRECLESRNWLCYEPR